MRTLVATALVAALAGATGSALFAPRVVADPPQYSDRVDVPILPPVDTGPPTPLSRSYVRLYSEGKVVDSWDPAGPGRMDGNSFVFPIRRGDTLQEVRIFGSFTYEGVPITH